MHPLQPKQRDAEFWFMSFQLPMSFGPFRIQSQQLPLVSRLLIELVVETEEYKVLWSAAGSKELDISVTSSMVSLETLNLV